MKILLFTRPLAPPWDEASKNLAFDLAQNLEGDFEVEILTTPEFAKKLTEESHLRENYFARIKANPCFPSGKFGLLAKIKLLRRLYRIKLDADIVHFLFTPRSFTSFLIKLRLFFSRAKTVQTVATISSAVKKIDSRNYFTNCIITQSKHTQARLEKANLKNVQCIYPGLDLEKFQPAGKDKQLVKQLGFSENDFLIQYSGEYVRMDERTVDDILDAMEILWEKDADCKLIMAVRLKSTRDRQKKLAVVEKLKKKGYDRHVVFLDFFNEMPVLFNTTDVQIFPPRKMSGKFDIPYAVLEPLACSRSVIVSDLPVLQEFIRHRENGLVINQGNPSQLAVAIEQVKNDSALRTKIETGARQYVEENFNIKNTAQKYAEVYRKL